MRNRDRERGTPSSHNEGKWHMVGDGREGDAEPSPTEPLEGLRSDAGLAEPQKLAFRARRRNELSGKRGLVVIVDEGGSQPRTQPAQSSDHSHSTALPHAHGPLLSQQALGLPL